MISPWLKNMDFSPLVYFESFHIYDGSPKHENAEFNYMFSVCFLILSRKFSQSSIQMRFCQIKFAQKNQCSKNSLVKLGQ